MSKESVFLKLEHLEAKVKKVLDAYQTLKANYQESVAENELLRNQLEKKSAELKNFQNQYKISKIATAVTEDTKIATEYKLKINEYIREIEKGLAYLNRL